MRQPIITFWDTAEDKSAVVMLLSEKIVRKWKTQRAFDRMFGTNAPHHMIERLFHLNSRVLLPKYNERVFRLLAGNPEHFYADENYMEDHVMSNIWEWDDGTLLARWEKSTESPNPHHILSRSRWWKNSPHNLWQFDRATHDDFHLVFQNLTPTEQARLLVHYFERNFSQAFKAEITKILSSEFPDPIGYKPKAVHVKDFF